MDPALRSQAPNLTTPIAASSGCLARAPERPEIGGGAGVGLYCGAVAAGVTTERQGQYEGQRRRRHRRGGHRRRWLRVSARRVVAAALVVVALGLVAWLPTC